MPSSILINNQNIAVNRKYIKLIKELVNSIITDDVEAYALRLVLPSLLKP